MRTSKFFSRRLLATFAAALAGGPGCYRTDRWRQHLFDLQYRRPAYRVYSRLRRAWRCRSGGAEPHDHQLAQPGALVRSQLRDAPGGDELRAVRGEQCRRQALPEPEQAPGLQRGIPLFAGIRRDAGALDSPLFHGQLSYAASAERAERRYDRHGTRHLQRPGGHLRSARGKLLQAGRMALDRCKRQPSVRLHYRPERGLLSNRQHAEPGIVPDG